MIELKEYQKKAIESLCNKINNCLRTTDNEIVIFQAPTGSGKTLMVSEVLKELVRNRKIDPKFSFVWISVRMLHEQSKEKIEKYYENNRLLKCSYFEDLEDKKIAENEILFINWHSINKKDINIYIRENEQDNNLNSIIQNTKDEGRTIILIIDESHHTAHSEKSRELVEIISPKITLEASATPHLETGSAEKEKVRLADVKKEEMIKSEISVNPEFLKIIIGSKSSDEIVIEQALKKREELVKMYEKEGSDINPLILIQLPDSRGDLIDKKDDVIKILEKLKITEDNGKLAIWLSEDKSDTLPNIEKNDNEVQILVFKQAIALGWDCPRASILVIFRESKSFIFTIQTIGRIMRMPELKYYTKEPELNRGFVFTNLPNIEITEDYAKDYMTIYESKRNNTLYNEISLPSVFLKRQRERTRLSGEFSKIFLSIAEETNLEKKVKKPSLNISQYIIADGVITDIDMVGVIKHKGTIDVQLKEKELQEMFDKFIIENCTPYAPADSSDRMKTAIYLFCRHNYSLAKYDSKVQILVMENKQLFTDTLNLAKERYANEVIKKLNEKREIQVIDKWEAPLIISYNSKYRIEEQNKSIMIPYYTSKPSDPEKIFIKSLEDSDKVKWWLKNGDGEIKYFAIPYKDENGFEWGFYVDFIVMFKNKSIGLFDTKKGITAKEAGHKANALQRYIKEQNKKGKKLWGGIATFANGSWRYNDEEKYHYNPKDLSNWKILSF